MATSPAMSTNSDKIKYTVSINQNSRNTSANTSSVTVSVRVYRTNTGYTTYGSGTVYVTINGTQYTEAITSSDKITNSGIVLFTKTLNIAHNADGTKTLTVSARITHDQFSSSNQSYSQTLVTIPRATTPTLSASSVNMGSNITINMPRASSSFDHTVTYKFGNATGTIGENLGTSKVWTVPLSLASQIPNGVSGSCTITVKTYNGSTLIGTKTVSFTAKVPASVVPSISSMSIAEAVSGLATQFGAYVQGKSKLKVTVTATGAYGSTISSYKTTINGTNYTTASFTSGVLSKSGSASIVTTVTDSRGRTASKTSTVNVVAYTAPTITAFTAYRATSAGAENYEGTAARVAMQFDISPVGNKNTKSHKVEYKPKTGSTWTTISSGSAYSVNTSVTVPDILSTDNSYDVRLTVTDYFGSASVTVDISTAFTLMDYNANGRGIAFGKVSEREGIEFALPIYSTQGHLVTSPVVLKSGTDLDSLTEPGYYVFASGVSTTLVNSPLGGSGSGYVEVTREGESNQVRMQITRCSEPFREIWERVYYSNSWKSWSPMYKSGTGRILWEGAMYMTAGHTAPLDESITAQPNGIVLVFSRYLDGAAQENNYFHFFIPKSFIVEKNGYGHTFIMAANRFAVIATKYLYINNDRITGHADNSASGTANGITYNNGSFVLRYVVGV